MNVQELKRFIAEIPEQYDGAKLTYCDFSYGGSLVFRTYARNGKSYVSIGDGDDEGSIHTYRDIDLNVNVKTIPVKMPKDSSKMESHSIQVWDELLSMPIEDLKEIVRIRLTAQGKTVDENTLLPDLLLEEWK